MVDTRKDKRAPVSLKVRFKSATVDEFIEHYSRDVSRGGIFIKSSQPMAVGTLLKFQFQLKDESALIRGVGRVVWTRAEEDAGEDAPAGMGIKFIKMDNDSRAMVDRIVDAHAPGQGTYERGRESATTVAASSSAPPPHDSHPAPAGEEPFFPDLPPAEEPPPEDRTAVRQAAQFLAAALTEGGTDEAAAREAQEKAEEAKRRTEEIEAQRKLEAEQRKRKEPAAPSEPLPSMIIDPSLDARTGGEAERPTEIAVKPPTAQEREEEARKRLAAESEDDREPDTEPPPAPEHTTTTTSIPPPGATRARPNYLPIAVIAFVLAIALAVALRGGPKELPVEAMRDEEAEPAAAVQNEQPAVEPVPSEEPAAVAEPEEPAATADAASEPEVPAGPVTKLSVVSVPRGAQISVGGEPRGAAPLTLELTAGVPALVSARAPGFAEAREEVTPSAKPAAQPLRFKLKALPYLVEAETDPPGASINVGGHKGVTPVTLKLDQPPTADLSVTAKLAGHRTGHTRVAQSSFSEVDGAMRAKLTLTLEPAANEPERKASDKPAAASPKPAKPKATAKPSAPPAEPASGGGDASEASANEGTKSEGTKAEAPAEKPSAESGSAPTPASADGAAAAPREPSLPTNPFDDPK